MRWGRSFRLATRVLLDEGIVAYLLVLLFLSSALLVGRGLYVRMQPENAKSEALRGLLSTESEPLRPEKNAALTTGFLYGFDHWDICARSNADLRDEVGCAFYAFSNLYQAGSSIPETACPRWNANKEITAIHQSLGQVDFRARAIVPFGVGSADLPVQSTTKIEPALTEAGAGKWQSSLIIPSTLSAEVERCEPRITRALRRSHALERLQVVLEHTEARSAPYKPSIQSYYFVSFDGFLRTVPNQPIEALVPHRPFNHASYVVDTLQIPIDRELVANGVLESSSSRRRQTCTTLSEDVYVTRPYLDIYGNGIVQTICNRLILQPSTAPKSDVRAPKTTTSSMCGAGDPRSVAAAEMKSISEPSVEGVFCADIGVDREFIHRTLAANPLLDTELYQFEDADKNQGSQACRKSPASLRKCPRRFLDGEGKESFDCEHTVEVEAETRAKLIKWWCDEKTESSSGYAGITPLDPEEQERAAVVWDNMPSTNGGAHMTQVAIIRAKPSFAAGPRIIISMLLAALALAICARMAAAHARRRSENLLRGLQVGLLRVDIFEGITGANARAETILDVKLPRFGMHFADPALAPGERKFIDLIDESLAVEGSKGADRYVVVRERDKAGQYGFVRRSYADMSRLREKGISSEYWVRIKRFDRGMRWVKITGSPILPAEYRIHSAIRIPGTYGVVEAADDRIIADLELALASSEPKGERHV